MFKWVYGDCNRFAYRDPMPLAGIEAERSGNTGSYTDTRPVYLQMKLEHGDAAADLQAHFNVLEATPFDNGVDALHTLRSLCQKPT